MRTLKNAFRNVSRAKGRSILICVIIVIIAFSKTWRRRASVLLSLRTQLMWLSRQMLK